MSAEETHPKPAVDPEEAIPEKRAKKEEKRTRQAPIGTASLEEAFAKQAEAPLCCFFIQPGRGCNFPPGTGKKECAHKHAEDDGVTRCQFGPTCRHGHARRVLPADLELRKEFWDKFGGHQDTPAARDATLIRSQIECWNTPTLKRRLENEFALPAADVEKMNRDEVIAKILDFHSKGGNWERKTYRVNGTPVRLDLIEEIKKEMDEWADRHQHNDRPSIRASSYTILRSPAEFSQKDSNAAKIAARKIELHSTIWGLALTAISEVDPEFAKKFTALALTKNFKGSPHIDRQNTGPFYGLSFGTFPDGEGGVCVEANAFEVAHVNTKNRLGKVDGRYPHWVAPYDETCERYSLIFYQTDGEYLPPGPAHFGERLQE